MKLYPSHFYLPLLCLMLLLSLNTKGQSFMLHRDLQYTYSDQFGQLDTGFTSERSAAPVFSLDSLFADENKEIKVNDLTKWYWEKLFNDNLITLKGKNYAVTVDPYFDMRMGKETAVNKVIWNNKRGIMLNSRFGKKVKIHTYFTQNLMNVDPYIRQWSERTRILPGEGEAKIGPVEMTNFYTAGALDYQLNEFIDFTFGHGKNFLGDGYRSLLLSDAASAYPFARFNLHFGKRVNYTAIVAEFLDNTENSVPVGFTLRRKKYTSFHYLDIKVHRKLFVGFYEAVIWGGDSLSRSTFEVNYLNPFVVMRPLEFGLGSPDNVQLGTNVKYLPFKGATLYGQFLLTEFYGQEFFGGRDWFGNKYGFQLGGKFHNFPFAKNLFLQLEYNQIRPFTYNHRSSVTSFAHNGQPLAHPSGGNLKEGIAILNYRVKRWSVNWRSVYRISGLENTDSTSIGTDVQRSYYLRESEFGNVIGQGKAYRQWYNQFTLSYLLNPSNRMALEAGVVNRHESTAGIGSKQYNYIFFGIRTGFLNTYHDF